jgi:hypothetical protein
MTDNVKWFNDMKGGYVYGSADVRQYWTGLFTIVTSNVTPLKINGENDVIKIRVYKIVYDLNGYLLADRFVYHYFILLATKLPGLILARNERIISFRYSTNKEVRLVP